MTMAVTTSSTARTAAPSWAPISRHMLGGAGGSGIGAGGCLARPHSGQRPCRVTVWRPQKLQRVEVRSMGGAAAYRSGCQDRISRPARFGTVLADQDGRLVDVAMDLRDGAGVSELPIDFVRGRLGGVPLSVLSGDRLLRTVPAFRVQRIPRFSSRYLIASTETRKVSASDASDMRVARRATRERGISSSAANWLA